MTLFQLGDFVLHSGVSSNFKIDCDALSDEDWECLAALVAKNVSFSRVVGIPEGGLRFAAALATHACDAAQRLLIVDDVLTTGASMEAMRLACGSPRDVTGVVVFSRGQCPSWVRAIFTLLL